MTSIAILNGEGVVVNIITAPSPNDGDWTPPPNHSIWDQAPLPQLGYRLVNGSFEPPTPIDAGYIPTRVSRIDFRRLLKPDEAAKFRLLEKAPAVTQDELAAAFDPENPDVTLQIRVAVEDAIQQWNLLDSGVIELNHPDTLEFLQIMGLAGMFGANASTRIPQILNQQPPT